MEFWHNLVVHEINLVTKEVKKQQTNPVPSFIVVSSTILLNIKFMATFIRTQLR
jgi:hypothetical protein